MKQPGQTGRQAGILQHGDARRNQTLYNLQRLHILKTEIDYTCSQTLWCRNKILRVLAPVNPDWLKLPGFTFLASAHPGSPRVGTGATVTPRAPRGLRGDGYGTYGESAVLNFTGSPRGGEARMPRTGAKSCCVKIASPGAVCVPLCGLIMH